MPQHIADSKGIMVHYLDASTVVGVRTTDIPTRGQTRSGYGRALPTRWLLRLTDGRWRRVVVACWSNSGSAYIRVGGRMTFLGDFEPARWLKSNAEQFARILSGREAYPGGKDHPGAAR